jgi:hypothetical protein
MNSTFSHLSAYLLLGLAGPCTDPVPLPSDLFADRKPTAAEPSGEAPAPATKQQTATTSTFMREHTAEARAMRQAAIGGRLDELRRVAATIQDDAWTPSLRPDYRSHLESVRAVARKAAQASALPEAAAALGELGAACAACHQAVGGPAEPVAPPSPRGDDAMAAHAAAEAALWVGLSTPSEASWLRGARALVDAPALDSDVQEVSSLAHLVSRLAQRGIDNPAARVETYGKLLSTCASCHVRLGVDAR